MARDIKTEEEKALEGQMRILRNSIWETGMLDHTLDGDICLGEEFKRDLLRAVKNYGAHLENTDGPRDN